MGGLNDVILVFLFLTGQIPCISNHYLALKASLIQFLMRKYPMHCFQSDLEEILNIQDLF